ncbi:unnamed protein product [Brassica oleracea var. botrytis]
MIIYSFRYIFIYNLNITFYPKKNQYNQTLESAFGEDSCASKEDKIVVPLRKDPEVEKKKKPEHEHESEFGEEKESKERKEKALKEIEMGNAAYKATVLSKCDHV